MGPIDFKMLEGNSFKWDLKWGQLYIAWFHDVFVKPFSAYCNMASSGESIYDSCVTINCDNRVFSQIIVIHTSSCRVNEGLDDTENQKQLILYLTNKYHHHYGIKFWMLLDLVSHYCLIFLCIEDKSEIRMYGLDHTDVMKWMKVGNSVSRVAISSRIYVICLCCIRTIWTLHI